MKTTLILDDDVCGGAFAASAQLRQPFQVVINDALRVGLALLAKTGESPINAEALAEVVSPSREPGSH
jgi:hypothetical protein